MKSIAENLKQADKVCIFTHISPDGDALGSSFALKRILECMGKTADLYLEKDLPEKFHFLAAPYRTDEPGSEYDAAVCLDCGDAKRLGRFADSFAEQKLKLAIDHHLGTPSFADFNVTDATAAAAAELVYLLSQELGVKLDNYTQKCLFTGISTDTGNFKYSNTTARTFQIAGELASLGLHIREVTKLLYDTVKLSKLKFTGAIADRIQLYQNGKFAVLEAPESLFDAYTLQHEDVEELPSIPLSIEGVLVSLVIKDNDQGGKKYSLRGKEIADMSAVAKLFGGGGHRNAAGFTSTLPVNEVIAKINDTLPLEEISKTDI